MKRLFVIFIAVLLITGLCPTAFAADEPELPTTNWIDYTEKVNVAADGVTYEIYKAEQLAWVTYAVAMQSSTFSGKTIKLMEHLDLSAHLWTPIGATEQYAFNGTFDGNDKTIKGMTISGSYAYAGLIGNSPNIVSSLYIDDAYISNNTTANNPYNGIIIGRGNVQNCMVNNCILSIISSSNNMTHTGGLTGVGFANNCQVLGCTIDISSNGRSYSGGITGNGRANDCMAIGCRIGVTGTINNIGASTSPTVYTGSVNGYGDTINCSAKICTITALSTATASMIYIGGLSGTGNSSDSQTTECYITAYTTDISLSYAGGIIGGGSATDCITSSCEIKTTSKNTFSNNDRNPCSGGIAGSATSVTNCAVIDTDVKIKIDNSTGYAGGLAGSGGQIKACYCDAEVTHTESTGTAVLGAFVGKQTGFIQGYYNSDKAGTLPAVGEKTSDVSMVFGRTLEIIKSQAFADTLNSYWLNTEDDTDDVNAIWALDTDDKSLFPTPHAPVVTGLEITPPDRQGGSAYVKVIGENLEFAYSLFIATNSYYSSSMTKYEVDKATLTAEIPTNTQWQSNTDGYYLRYNYFVFLNYDNNNLNSSVYSSSGTFTLPYDATTAVITSLTYTPTASGNGAVVPIIISGNNLNTTTLDIRLNAYLNDGSTIYALIEKKDGVITARLPLPKNITASSQFYTLRVSLGGYYVNFTATQTLTVLPDTAELEYDLNDDGAVDVLDLILLQRHIISAE